MILDTPKNLKDRQIKETNARIRPVQLRVDKHNIMASVKIARMHENSMQGIGIVLIRRPALFLHKLVQVQSFRKLEPENIMKKNRLCKNPFSFEIYKK